jgi:hypothetical protein
MSVYIVVAQQYLSQLSLRASISVPPSVPLSNGYRVKEQTLIHTIPLLSIPLEMALYQPLYQLYIILIIHAVACTYYLTNGISHNQPIITCPYAVG